MSSVPILSTIDRVKLYHQGARVYRTLSATLPEQASSQTHPTMSIELTGLPLSLQDETLKLLLTSQRNEWAVSDIKIGLHVARRENLPEAPDESELRDIEVQLTMLRSQRELLQEEQSLIATMESPERPEGRDDMPPPASPLKARLAMESFVNAAIEDRITKGRALKDKIERLEENRKQLNDQIARASSARKVRGNEVSKVVIAQLTRQRGESTDVDLELSYMVPGARWAPQYTCRIERTGASADIQMRALVIQSSGEDWKGVSLELSTADPMSWTELPKLNSLRIGKAQAVPASKPGFRPAPKGAALLFRDYDEAHQRANILAPVPSHQAPGRLPHRDVMSFVDQLAQFERPTPAPIVTEAPALETNADYMQKEMSMSAPAEVGRRSRAKKMRAPMAPPPAPAQRGAAPTASYASASVEEELDDLLAELEEMDEGLSFGGAAPGPSKKKARKPSTPKRSALSFHELKLSTFESSSSSSRGILRTSTRTERYMQIFARSELVADFDVTQVLDQATQVAMLSANTTLPHGAKDVRSSAGFFDYVYKTRNRVDIQSDRTYHSVPVDTREAECELRYVAVPREAQHVFREAAIANPHRAPMLSGPAEIYVGDEYVLTTTLPTVAPKERFRLGLGVEQAIKCARNTSYREERSGRAVVATAELHHEIRIELVNNLERAIMCEVRERIPHPAPDAEVVIEEVEVTPAWEEYTQVERRQVLLGGRVWNLEINPGEQVDLLAHYVVKIYANNEITGGNRRES